MAEVASLAEKVTATAWLYQPFESGCRPGLLSVTVGSVSSYLSANAFEPLTLPAISRPVPLTEVEGSAGPEEVASVQGSTPEVASLPEKSTVTAWLYQPPASGARDPLPPS